MICSLTIVRYPRWFGWAGFLSMGLFRMPLWLSKGNSFWKLMGCGKNGSFDIRPDWRQWALLQIPVIVNEGRTSPAPTPQTPNFIRAWWKLFRCEVWTILLTPIEGHGTWDGRACFGDLPKQTDYEGLIGVLTRATIRLSKLNSFWRHVDGAASQMATADGFITSLGIGEVPWIKQATFSLWDSKAKMKQFAYQMQEHAAVVRKTRKEGWYSEEMFVRFTILASYGTIRGKTPLERKL